MELHVSNWDDDLDNILDAWVGCRDDTANGYKLKCHNDGSFTINFKAGSDATLPQCGTG